MIEEIERIYLENSNRTGNKTQVIAVSKSGKEYMVGQMYQGSYNWIEIKS